MLESRLCDELKDIADEGKITRESLEFIDKLTHSIKNIKRILSMDDEDAGYSMMRRMYPMIGTRDDYDGDNSYRRRRDRYGRYSRDGEDYSRDRDGDGYSRDGGSGICAHLMEQIKSWEQNAKDDKEREAFRRCLEEIKKA